MHAVVLGDFVVDTLAAESRFAAQCPGYDAGNHRIAQVDNFDTQLATVACTLGIDHFKSLITKACSGGRFHRFGDVPGRGQVRAAVIRAGQTSIPDDAAWTEVNDNDRDFLSFTNRYGLCNLKLGLDFNFLRC